MLQCLLGPIGRAFPLGGRTHWEPWSWFSPHVVLGCYRFARERRGGARQGRSSVDSGPTPETEIAPLRPHFPFALTSGRGLSSPLVALAPVVASPPLVVASPPVIASPPLASPALRPHLRPHCRIYLLPTPLHSGRTSSHSVRSPSPKPLHRRICLLLTPLHSGRTFTAGPKPFPETPSPPDLPPPDAPPLGPKHFTSGPNPFPEAPSQPTLPPPDTPSLRSKPFTSGPKPLHLPRILSPPAKPLHLRLHLRTRPYTSARSPPPPASPTPEAPSCPEGRNRNFLVVTGWTVLCPREASYLVGHRL
uniref:Vegetative cell wall protein gp1-like n=1 Tax=Ananas comosus var. bracteatus TaxID=296719 RepID=A0A6V7NWQ3_ANACO|nr:unnamed protein product [Ananas comosus var. bracteatus]